MNSSDRIRCVLLAAALANIFAGCASTPRFTGRNDRTVPTANPASPVSTRTSSDGKALLTLEGVASYYADDFHGRKTSNGEVYDMYGLTAAHRNLPFGTKILVTNLENDKALVVRVNDRGPFHEDRIIDLSLGAARELGFEQRGTARVRLDIIEWGDGR
jgi:rare lipoprotein A